MCAIRPGSYLICLLLGVCDFCPVAPSQDNHAARPHEAAHAERQFRERDLPARAARLTGSMHSFFNELDRNRDGQIEAREAQRYIATQLDESATDAASHSGGTASFDAATKLLHEMDGLDKDETVSESEMERSLTKRLQARCSSGAVHFPMDELAHHWKFQNFTPMCPQIAGRALY